ncbi:MAG TPA: hypothetical protein VJN93_02745 [Candidatus Acidoferrum sp.]|nr:hypothetical protein [Candidatus Acidoferrum sp.]
MSAKSSTRKQSHASLTILFAALAVSLWAAGSLRPQHMVITTAPSSPAPEYQNGHLIIPFSNRVASAELATFDDQLEAFLRFDYLRGRDPKDAANLLLTSSQNGNRIRYKIFLWVENDQLTALPQLDALELRGLISHYDVAAWSPKDLAFAEQETQTLMAAYNMPPRQKLENVPTFQLLPALADFLAFKSQTDWRVVGQIAAAPQPLTRRQALRLASDILDVAHFYSLPLDYFLGVGAMENNYMNVDGDLQHAVWKKRAQRGDIILERRRRQVLVSDYSIGTWQISRETLRAAHQLYLKDHRNYDELPPRLRPPRQLDLKTVDSDVLTTYAGILLRGLLDRFGGDVDQAIGAYNGGARNPNPAYAAGVRNVALYARRVLEHAPLSPAKPAAASARNGTAL